MNRQPGVEEDDSGFRNEENLAEQIQIEHRADGKRVSSTKGTYLLLERGTFAEPTRCAFSQGRNQSLQQRLLTNEKSEQQGEEEGNSDERSRILFAGEQNCRRDASRKPYDCRSKPVNASVRESGRSRSVPASFEQLDFHRFGQRGTKHREVAHRLGSETDAQKLTKGGSHSFFPKRDAPRMGLKHESEKANGHENGYRERRFHQLMHERDPADA